jgi:hypothetical protein
MVPKYQLYLEKHIKLGDATELIVTVIVIIVFCCFGLTRRSSLVCSEDVSTGDTILG